MFRKVGDYWITIYDGMLFKWAYLTEAKAEIIFESARLRGNTTEQWIPACGVYAINHRKLGEAFYICDGLPNVEVRKNFTIFELESKIKVKVTP